jgi:hypothetical protein
LAIPPPARQRQIIANAAQRFGVDPSLLWGVYGAETNFGQNVRSSGAGAVGPFQFMPATAQGLGVDPNNFRSAAFGAARYLSQYKDRGTAGMLAAYNAGPSGNPHNPETQAYIPKVQQLAKGWSGQAPTMLSGGPQSASRQQFDQAGFDQQQKRFQLGQFLQNARSPFQDFGPRSQIRSSNPLLSVLPSEAPNPQDYTRAVQSLRQLAGGLNVKLPKGGGYGGTETVVRSLVDPIAGRFGIQGSSYKRTPEQNAAVGGAEHSDHLTTNRRAFAADYPTTNGGGLARQIAGRLGIRGYQPGTYTKYPVVIGGRRFRAQILWGVEGHGDHVHVGLEAV